MVKCKRCIGRYEYKTAYPCRYCIENKEIHTYLGIQKDIEVRSYYREVKIQSVLMTYHTKCNEK